MHVVARALLSSCFGPVLLAQGLYVGPEAVVPPGWQPAVERARVAASPDAPAPAVEPARLSVTRTSVRAVIQDGAATTEVEQTFHNGFGRVMEATWMLPLPAGAMADGFTMMVGDQLIAGEVVDARAARQVYEQIVRQRRDPGLLEYAGNGLLRARVFPIPPHGDCTVKVRFRQLLVPTGGLYEWSWPLRMAQLGDGDGGPIGIDLRIRSQTPIKSVLATLPAAEILRQGEHEARVGLELASGGPRTDLRVLYGLGEQDFGLHLLPFRRSGEDGYFAMMLAPRRDWQRQQMPRECIRFAIDTSGSMRGRKIEQARAALRSFVRALRPDDWFDIVPFSTEARPLFGTPRQATAANVQAALQGIDALDAEGGTNIGEALRAVLATPDDDVSTALVPISLLVTDGAPTIGICDPQQLLTQAQRQNRQGARLFVFGVGNDVDTKLLDQLAADNRGARDYVLEDEDLEVKTSALFAKLVMPVLTDVEVRCPELDGFDVFPRRTGDLFAGELLQLVGRYRGDGKKTIEVRGNVGGEARRYEFTVEFPRQSERFDFVPAMWAQKKVMTLLDQIRLHGAQQELVGEVSRLSRDFGITTPYTSHLILEEGMRLGAGYRGAGDRVPAVPRAAGSGGAAGPTTPGPASPGGPATGGVGVAGAGDLGAQIARDKRRLEQGIWPSSGAEAVRDSIRTGGDDFYMGATARAPVPAAPLTRTAQQNVRRVADRAFYKVGERWVESGLPADWEQQAAPIAAFSEQYFELLAAHPQLRAAFALGVQVVLKVGDRIVSITG